MICPSCRRPYYFLKALHEMDKAVCQRCGHLGNPATIQYENYHETRYLNRDYKRNAVTDPQMRWILERLRITEADHVVELGCGVGDYTAEIAKRTRQVTGLDLNIQAAKGRYPTLAFQAHDLNAPFPIEENFVDIVISINVIEHLKEYDFFLRECRRILRPGGRIALSTFDREFILHAIHFDATHYWEWTLPEFEKILAPYFQTIALRKDCSMFKYFPLNYLLQFMIKPDISFLGRKP